MELRIKFPGTPREVQMKGRVVWARRALNQDLIEVGVAFQNLKKMSHRDKLFHFIANRLCESAVKDPGNYVTRLAQDESELKAVFSLLYKYYLKRGYCEPNSAGLYCNLFALLPDTRTFTLKAKNQIIGTISLIPDSACGLPSECTFAKEISGLRGPNVRIGEVGLLTLESTHFGKNSFSLTNMEKMKALFSIFKAMFATAKQMGLTHCVIAIHPKHDELYRYFMFEALGPVRAYSDGKPAVAMVQNVDMVYERFKDPNFLKGYFSDIATQKHDKTFFLTTNMVHHLINIQNMWPKISEQVREKLEEYYPNLTEPSRDKTSFLA